MSSIRSVSQGVLTDGSDDDVLASELARPLRKWSRWWPPILCRILPSVAGLASAAGGKEVGADGNSMDPSLASAEEVGTVPPTIARPWILISHRVQNRPTVRLRTTPD